MRPSGIGIFATLGATAIGLSWPAGLKVTGASLGFGNWAVETEGVANSCEDYGTWPSLGLYLGGGSWIGSLTLPWRASHKKSAQETRWSPGDFKVSLGRKIGWATPRATLQFPLYRWSVEDASVNELFIGSGNVEFGLGTALRTPSGLLPSRWSAGADLDFSAAVTAGLADFGTYHAAGNVGADYAVTRRLKTGISTLFLLDHSEWIPDYWDQSAETKFSIIPGVQTGFRFWKSSYVNLKAGMGAFEIRNLSGARFPDRPRRFSYFSGSVYQGF